MTIALKPCPFCGSTKVESCYSSWEYYRVDCAQCGTSGPSADVRGLPLDEQSAAEALACERWNRRVEAGACGSMPPITHTHRRSGSVCKAYHEQVVAELTAERDRANSDVERLKGELSNQECDTIYWKERAEQLTMEVCNLEIEVAELRNPPTVLTWDVPWPTEKDRSVRDAQVIKELTEREDAQNKPTEYSVEITWFWEDGTRSTARSAHASYTLTENGPSIPIVLESTTLPYVAHGYGANHPVSRWFDIDGCFIAEKMHIKTQASECIVYGAYMSMLTMSPTTERIKSIEIRGDRFRLIEKKEDQA